MLSLSGDVSRLPRRARLSSAKPFVQAPSLLGWAAFPTGSSFLRLRIGEEARGAAQAKRAATPPNHHTASNFSCAVWVGTHHGTKKLRPMNSVSSASVCVGKLPRKASESCSSSATSGHDKQWCSRLNSALRPRMPSSDVSPLSPESPISIASTKARKKCELVTHPRGGTGWVTNVF